MWSNRQSLWGKWCFVRFNEFGGLISNKVKKCENLRCVASVKFARSAVAVLSIGVRLISIVLELEYPNGIVFL